MKKYLRITLPVAVVAAAFCFCAVAHSAETKSSLSAGDKQFVKKAYKGGLTEVADAKAANEKAKDNATKSR